MKRKSKGDPASNGSNASAISWIASYSKVSRWLSQWDLLQLLDQNDGLIKIPNFLPPIIADEALRIVEAVPQRLWLPTAADQDESANNISHSFLSTKRGSPELEDLLRVFTLLLPETLQVFSAAKYSKSDHIAPHDDRAYVPIHLEDTGEIITCSRDVAVIYYLTKGWNREMGGVLKDLKTGKEYIPEYNSLVAFRIPRFHEVTAVASERPRLSIFGWFLQPGKMYEIFGGETKEEKGERKGDKIEKMKREVEEEEEDIEGAVLEPEKCLLAQRIIANSKKKKR